jgi:hypothetical protein
MFASSFIESGPAFAGLIPIAVLLGVGFLLGSLWSRGRDHKK